MFLLQSSALCMGVIIFQQEHLQPCPALILNEDIDRFYILTLNIRNYGLKKAAETGSVANLLLPGRSPPHHESLLSQCRKCACVNTDKPSGLCF